MAARAKGVAWIALATLRADRRGAAVNAAAACVGAAALVFFLALGLGVGEAARRLFPADARLVEVVPASVSLGGVLGGGKLDDGAVERLRALPGAEEAWPRLSLRVPIAAAGAPKGLDYSWPSGMTFQLPLVVGVPAELFEGEVEPAAFEDGGAGAPLAAVISRRLVENFNKKIAPAHNVRRLPPGLSIVGLELPVRVGLSVIPLRTEDRVQDARLRLVGLSDRLPLEVVAVPLETVRRLHAEYGKRDEGYTQVSVRARTPEDVPAVTAAVRRMGFTVDDEERGQAERVGTIVVVTTGALVFLAGVMCALAALAIAQSLSASVRARAKEIAVLQALGAAPSDVRRVVLLEGAIVGLAGGLAGAVLAWAAALGADRLASRVVPDFPFRPETFFAFPAWVLLLGVAVPVLSSVVGALAPAAAAARVDPARALS